MCASRTGNSCRPNWKDSMGFAVLPVDENKTKNSFPPLQFDKIFNFYFQQPRGKIFRLLKIKSTHGGDLSIVHDPQDDKALNPTFFEDS